MKKEVVIEVLAELKRWHSYQGSLDQINFLLEARKDEIYGLFFRNGISDVTGRVADGYSYQDCVNTLLMYIALRRPFSYKGKR